jgi:pyridoxal phosphate enzyme (YggS family)
MDDAARRAGRSPDDVTLVAVSKTFSPDVVKQAIELGVRDLGENRAQELKQKVAVLGRGPNWHFVGHLQTNKVRQVAGLAALIHSVDRFGLAEALDRRAASLGIVQNVLLEVNVSGEATKHGVEPAGLARLAEQVGELPHLEVSGLMTMAPFSDDAEASRPYFADLRSLRDEIRVALPAATHLSMGMTRDMEVAIEEGATLVRVGEAIFGPRRPTA